MEITEEKKFIHIDNWFAGFMNFLVENILFIELFVSIQVFVIKFSVKHFGMKLFRGPESS